jgi:FtsP/CotA-like multicopper oxidase with cupredoxin domain
MKLTRREALKLGLIGTGSLFSPIGLPNSALAQSTTGCPSRPREMEPPILTSPPFSPQFERFTLPFKRPPTLKPFRSDDIRDYYTIRMQKVEMEILPNLKTQVWRYVGNPDPTTPETDTLVGPVIRQPKLRRSAVRFINELGKDSKGKEIQTSIHLHGMASLPQYDGYTEDLIPDQYYKDYYYPNNRAATLWYHDHAVGKTSRNVYMGLAGMYIVEYAPEDFQNPEDSDRLPKDDYDVSLIIQDRRFGRDGQLLFNDLGQRASYGDIMLVNGVPWPRMEVANRKYRFRILNGGPSRTLQLALSTGDDLVVIASDAGLLAEPVRTQTLRVGVAERYEFIVDFSKHLGKRVILQNPALDSNVDSDARSLAIMAFDVTRQEPDDSQIPAKLGKVRSVEDILAADGLTLAQVRTRTFRFGRNNGQWKINNKTWDKNRVDANPGLCDIEIWNLVNTGGGWVHPVHIHLVDLRLLSRNGLPPLPYEQGWKDVFYVGEFETLRVLAKFGPHEGKYMMHCHNLVHEDHDMMTQFQVGKDGCDPCSAPAHSLPAPSAFDPPLCIPPQQPCPTKRDR